MSLTVSGFLGQGAMTKTNYITVFGLNETYLPLIQKQIQNGATSSEQSTNSDVIGDTTNNSTLFHWLAIILIVGSPIIFGFIRKFEKNS